MEHSAGTVGGTGRAATARFRPAVVVAASLLGVIGQAQVHAQLHAQVHAQEFGMGAAFAQPAAEPPALWAGGASLWAPAPSYSLAVAAGASHWRADCPQTLICDRNATSFRVTGAWTFSPGLSIELFYVDEGQVKARAWAMPDNVLQTTRLRVRGGGLGAAWWVPLDTRWFGVVRAGGVFHHARFDENQDATTALTPSQQTHDHFDPAVGLGLSYRFSPQWQIDSRLDWTSTRLRPQSTSLLGGGTTAAHHWSLGVTYGF